MCRGFRVQHTDHTEACAAGRVACEGAGVSAAFMKSASVVLPGLRSRTDGADDRRRLEGFPSRPEVRVVRGRSIQLLIDSTVPIPPSAGEGQGREIPAAQATQVKPSAREAGGKEENS